MDGSDHDLRRRGQPGQRGQQGPPAPAVKRGQRLPQRRVAVLRAAGRAVAQLQPHHAVLGQVAEVALRGGPPEPTCSATSAAETRRRGAHRVAHQLQRRRRMPFAGSAGSAGGPRSRPNSSSTSDWSASASASPGSASGAQVPVGGQLLVSAGKPNGLTR